MPQYRAYIVGRDGYAKKAVHLDCPDDGAAIESAKQLVNGHDVDLWAQGRQIIKINSDDRNKAASPEESQEGMQRGTYFNIDPRTGKRAK